MKSATHAMRLTSACAVSVLLAACGSDSGGSAVAVNEQPTWLKVMQKTTLDGQSDDLLTAGLGVDALLGNTPIPTYADALNPTPQELRRAALVSRYNTGAGEGRLFGSNLDANGQPVAGPGKIAGTELLAFADDGSGRQNVGMLLQLPASFDPGNACILAVPVNGSARLYADVQRFGGWGLRRNCAVVYTDKGQGNGIHDLASNTALLINGQTVDAKAAGANAHFAADLGDAARQQFLAAFPNRIAFKHAHSKQNPDATWGRDVVRSVEFAFFQLNEMYGTAVSPTQRAKMLGPANTLVIAVGDSNGGGAALKGGEADTEGLIDGIVAGQPQIQPTESAQVTIQRSGRSLTGGGKSLIDYFTFAILYQPCAVLATPTAPLAGTITFAANRCASLRDKNLLSSNTLQEQADEALGKLHDYGWEPGSDPQQAQHFLVAPNATAYKYASAQGRFGVEDRLCNYSIANTDAQGRPIPVTRAQLATIWVTAAGGAPVGNIDMINDNDPTGPRRDSLSVTPSTGRQDYNIDGALCLRSLVSGSTTQAQRVQQGIQEIRATGNLRGRPTIIVHGREDTRVPTNFASRPYLGLNSLVEGSQSKLRYIEVTNISHLTAGAPFDNTLVPLTYYEEFALNQMWAHLKRGAALPGHQVVHTIPRGGQPGSAPDIQQANLPPIALTPAAQNAISVSNGVVAIQE